MFRFTIRDVLWLTVVVAMGAAWGMDRWEQNIRIKIVNERAGSLNHTLRHYVDALTRELQYRGHRVEIVDSKVFVDQPPAILQTDNSK